MRSFMKPLLAGWFHAHGDRILLRCSVNVTKCCSSGRKAQACGQTAEMALVEFERAAVHPRDALDDRQAEPEPAGVARPRAIEPGKGLDGLFADRKSTRLNSSH